MKTRFFRVPVSEWRDGPAVSTPAILEGELQVVKTAGRAAGKAEDYYLIPVGQRMTASSRLVVIVPPGEFDEREFALKVGRLSQWGRKEIHLVGLAKDPLDDSLLRRRMATLAAYLRSSHAEASYSLVFRANWRQAMSELLTSGDLLVCLENHFTPGRWFGSVSLAQSMASALNIPVCVMQGLRLEAEEAHRWQALREILVWISLILALALFLMFQIRIQQAALGALGTAIQVISLVVEIFVIVRLSSLGN